MRKEEVYIKIQEYDDAESVKEVIGVCDAELLGKRFREGDITLVVNEEFFKGFKASAEEAIEHLRNAYTAILVGEKIVKEAIKAGLVHPDSVLTVENVPFAQIARM